MARVNAWLAMAALSTALVGCGGGGGGTEEGHEVAAQYAGDIGSSDIAAGETAYNNVCAACHDGGAPNLDNLGWDPAHMRQQIREGEGRMPPISANRVSDEDREALLAYMTTTGAVTGTGEGPEVAAEDAQ